MAAKRTSRGGVKPTTTTCCVRSRLRSGGTENVQKTQSRHGRPPASLDTCQSRSRVLGRIRDAGSRDTRTPSASELNTRHFHEPAEMVLRELLAGGVPTSRLFPARGGLSAARTCWRRSCARSIPESRSSTAATTSRIRARRFSKAALSLMCSSTAKAKRRFANCCKRISTVASVPISRRSGAFRFEQPMAAS